VKMAHLHCTLPDPRGSQSSATPAKVIAEAISVYRRQLIAWLEVSVVLTNTGPLCHLKLSGMPVSMVQLQQHGGFEKAGGAR